MKRSVNVNLKKSKVYRDRITYLRDFFTGKKFKVLDVGNLGEGEKNVDIKPVIEENGGKYFGLDINKNLADSLKLNNQLIGDLHNLSGVIEDKQFDCVYAGQVIEHTWYPADIIKECRRILKDNGYLVLDTPHIFNIWSIIRLYLLKKDTVYMDDAELVYHEARDNMRELREEENRISTQPQHKIFYSAAMLRQLLNMHGFKVEKFVFIAQPENWWHSLLLKIFPLGANKIGVIARKEELEKIFEEN